jgi:myo-inositol 2-dehydrogenase/D-chiro-inositol 1-dehydrogenase
LNQDLQMKEHVRYALIGCGMMGQEHLRNLALIDGAEVAVVFEPDAAMREATRALVPQARFVDDLPALLAAPDIGALVITSPNHCHAAQLQQIADARPLPVLCEKPLCVNLDEVAQMRALAARQQAPLWVAMEYRYMPPITALVQQAHAATDTGGTTMLAIREHRYPFLQKVGDWNRFSAHTGGTLVEKCCHFFDLMRLVMQADPLRVYASAAINHNHLDERYGGRQPDIIDNAFVVLDFPGQRRIEIPVPADLLAAGDHNGSTYFQHRKFFDVVRGAAQPVEVSLMDGLKAVIIGLAAEASARSGAAIDLTQGVYRL